MGTTFRSMHRVRTAGRRRLVRTTEAVPLLLDLASQTVADAEEIVADAWVQVLAGRRDFTVTGLRAAVEHYDGACRILSVARLEDDPVRIVAAEVGVEESLAAARAASYDYEHSHQELVVELELLAQQATERIVNRCMARDSGSAVSDAVSAPRSPTSCTAALSHVSRRIMSWPLFGSASPAAARWSR